jgi:hypothetical protein
LTSNLSRQWVGRVGLYVAGLIDRHWQQKTAIDYQRAALAMIHVGGGQRVSGDGPGGCLPRRSCRKAGPARYFHARLRRLSYLPAPAAADVPTVAAAGLRTGRVQDGIEGDASLSATHVVPWVTRLRSYGTLRADRHRLPRLHRGILPQPPSGYSADRRVATEHQQLGLVRARDLLLGTFARARCAGHKRRIEGALWFHPLSERSCSSADVSTCWTRPSLPSLRTATRNWSKRLPRKAGLCPETSVRA